MCARDVYTVPVVFGSRLVFSIAVWALTTVLWPFVGLLILLLPLLVPCVSQCVWMMCGHVKLRGWHWASSSIALHPVLRQDCSLSLAFISLARLTQRDPGICLVSSSQRCDCRHTPLYLAFTWVLGIWAPCFMIEQPTLYKLSCPQAPVRKASPEQGQEGSCPWASLPVLFLPAPTEALVRTATVLYMPDGVHNYADLAGWVGSGQVQFLRGDTGFLASLLVQAITLVGRSSMAHLPSPSPHIAWFRVTFTLDSPGYVFLWLWSPFCLQ